MTITCDTPISSIISIDDVEPIISYVKEDVESYSSLIKTIIESEESDGGLSSTAYYIDDRAELNIMANDFLNNLKIISSFDKCSEDIINAVNIQRKNELSLLKNKIIDRLKEIDSTLAHLRNSDPEGNSSRIRELEESFSYYCNKFDEVERTI